MYNTSTEDFLALKILYYNQKINCGRTVETRAGAVFELRPYRSGTRAIDGVTKLLNFEETRKLAKFLGLFRQRKGCL